MSSFTAAVIYRLGLLAALAGAAGAQSGKEVRLLDPLAVPLSGDPSVAVRTVTKPAHAVRRRCDLVVAGGGMGGVSAALSGARLGLHVCLTEPTHWLGGQMTSQGISAFDENRWIEMTGATRSYQDLRRRIRAAYAAQLLPGTSADRLNPGKCWVSAICFEPKVGVRVLDDLLADHVNSGAIKVYRRTVPVEARRNNAQLRSLLVYHFDTHKFTELEGTVFIDATELGDLLPLAGAGFRVGADAREDTGEPDAPEAADPQALQSFTYPFVLARSKGADVIRPSGYEQFLPQYSFSIRYSEGNTLRYGMYDKQPGTPGSFWTYRRLIAADQFVPGAYPSDLAMINWPGNDACNPGYLSSDPLTAARALQYGKQLAAGFAWWLKHEAPNDEGGSGFPDLALRTDVLGSEDGLSLYPYIREARRMVALETVREQDLAEPWQSGARARAYADSAGIGAYPIDIHGCGKQVPLPRAKPYQIPFGALLSRDVPNLLAGAKNLGVTQITNGAYRVHPTEWAIGEAAGTVAAAAIRGKRTPSAVYREPAALRRVQRQLLEAGHPLVWFDDVSPEDAAFADIQWAALTGLMPPAPDSLHFRPHDPVTGAEAGAALRALAERVKSASRTAPGFAKMPALEWSQLGVSARAGKVLRTDFAHWLCAQLRQ